LRVFGCVRDFSPYVTNAIGLGPGLVPGLCTVAGFQAS